MNSLEFDLLSPSQRVAYFDKTHGRCVLVDHWLMFEDGAMRERNFGALVDVPEDERLCARRIAIFHKTYYDNLCRMYHEFKDKFTEHLSAMKKYPHLMLPEPNSEDTERLGSLGKQALAAKSGYDKALADLQKLEPKPAASVESYDAERMARIDGLLKVAGINN